MKEVTKDFLMPISLRLEVSYLKGLAYKMKFVKHIEQIQNKYIKIYNENKHKKDDESKAIAKKYRKLAQKKPHRDLCRNKYLVEVPNFS